MEKMEGKFYYFIRIIRDLTAEVRIVALQKI